MATKRKTTTAVVAGVTALALVLGGTFAWTSISQQARNEAIVDINPGGRLHDDFNGTNKDVYVENFGDELNGVDIFARIRLDQYFEVGQDAGKNKDAGDRKVDIKLGGNINDPETWITYKPVDEDGKYITIGSEISANTNWKWQLGNDENNLPIFLPTFNMNKDSLLADINGTYEGTVKDDIVHYDDYKVYEDGVGYNGTEVHDWDTDANEEDGGVKAGAWDNGGIIKDSTKPIDDGDVLHKENQTHNARPISTTATVISMEQWIDDGMQLGDFWVYDADGWAYWANPIAPGETTGLLLDGIEMSRTPDDNWYYGINVVGQFATASDIYEFEGMSPEATELVELLTGKVAEDEPETAQLYLDNWNDQYVYAPIGTPVLIGYDPYDYDLDDGTELTDIDISSLTLTYTVWNEEEELDEDVPLTEEQYTYVDNVLTIIDDSLEGSAVWVVSACEQVYGYIYCYEYVEDEPSVIDDIYLYHDGDDDTFSGGEWFVFTADVYDENGDLIAETDEVTFTLTDQDGNEVTKSEAAAASISGFADTYMLDNNLFIADDILDSDITELTVTATYDVYDDEGKVAKTYERSCTLTRADEESPLKIGMKWYGRDYAANGDSFWIRTQTFDTNNRRNFRFSAKLNGETPKSVTWSVQQNSSREEYEYVLSEPDGEGWITVSAGDGWTANATNWEAVSEGTEIAKLNQNTGEFVLSLKEDLIPGNLAFYIEASVGADEGGYSAVTELFFVYHPVEFDLVNADVDNPNSLEAGEATFERGEETKIRVKPIFSEKEVVLEVNENTEFTWNLYYGDFGSDSMVEGYTVEYDNDGIWILTIPETIDEDQDTLRLVATYKGTPHPFGESGVYTSSPLMITASDMESEGIDTFEIIDERWESGTYESGAYVKIPLYAEALDSNGDAVWGTVHWTLGVNPPANVKLKYPESGSFNAELWIMGATEKITVQAMFSNPGETSVIKEASYTLSPADPDYSEDEGNRIYVDEEKTYYAGEVYSFVYSGEVTLWEVSGHTIEHVADGEGTYISDGVLFIDYDEPEGTKLTITATFDNGDTDTATVTVTKLERIALQYNDQPYYDGDTIYLAEGDDSIWLTGYDAFRISFELGGKQLDATYYDYGNTHNLYIADGETGTDGKLTMTITHWDDENMKATINIQLPNTGGEENA